MLTSPLHSYDGFRRTRPTCAAFSPANSRVGEASPSQNCCLSAASSHWERLAEPGASSLEDSCNEEISEAWSRAVLWPVDGRRRERGDGREGPEAFRRCRPRHLYAHQGR